jgi:hypothetical protein
MQHQGVALAIGDMKGERMGEMHLLVRGIIENMVSNFIIQKIIIPFFAVLTIRPKSNLPRNNLDN